MKIECTTCGYVYDDSWELSCPVKETLSSRVFGEKGRVLLMREPFILYADTGFLKCPVCGNYQKMEGI